jgi:hypothetical protein
VESLGPLHAFQRYQEPSSLKWLEVLFQQPRLSAINYKVRIFHFPTIWKSRCYRKRFLTITGIAILKRTYFDKVNKLLLECAEFTPKGTSKKTSFLPLTFNSK